MTGSRSTRASPLGSRGDGGDDSGEDDPGEDDAGEDDAEEDNAGEGPVNLDEIQAVIESAKARGTDQLATYVRSRLPEASATEVQDATSVLLDIIESVPLILAAAAQGAEDRNLAHVVQPVLDRAFRYFLHPVDLMPEMTLGLPGLLDDTYLVLRILQVLEEGPRPLVDWDLDHPTSLIRSLLDEDVGQQLDAMSTLAFEEVADDVRQTWGAEPLDA